MPTYGLADLPVISIKPGDRARPVNQDLVDELARSIEVSGLIQPIVVRPVSDGEHPEYQLIAGHHRYRAVRDVLKRGSILCAVRTVVDIEAELIEIDENLLRTPLSPAQEARAHSRRKELYLALHPETRAGVAGAAARHGDANDNLSYASEAAKSLGTTARTIQRHVSRGYGISDELADKIIGTSLDKGVELDRLAKLPAYQQAALADRAAAGENVSARQQRESVHSEGTTKQVALSAAEFGEHVYRRCTELASGLLEFCPPERVSEVAAALDISRALTLPAPIIHNVVERAAQTFAEALFEQVPGQAKD